MLASRAYSQSLLLRHNGVVLLNLQLRHSRLLPELGSSRHFFGALPLQVTPDVLQFGDGEKQEAINTLSCERGGANSGVSHRMYGEASDLQSECQLGEPGLQQLQHRLGRGSGMATQLRHDITKGLLQPDGQEAKFRTSSCACMMCISIGVPNSQQSLKFTFRSI